MLRAATLLLIPLALFAQALAATGKYAQAEPLLTRALAMEDAATGPDHPLLGPILDALGDVQRAQGHNADAEAAYVRALHLLERSAGDHGVALIPHLKLLAGVGRISILEDSVILQVPLRLVQASGARPGWD